MRISVKAPAKINLTLDVLAKRPDGYHEVEMVMTTVDLADRVDLTLREDGEITLDCSASFVPDDIRNHAYKAAVLLKERYQVRQGVRLYIDKQIPVAAGLAGGSSDAAATLRGLNQLWNLGLSLDELAEIGAEIGSDVPFCVYGGTALAKGRGEQITHLGTPAPCWVILAKPPIGVSTPDVYGNLRVDKIDNHPDTRQMLQAISEQDFSLMCQSLGNVLENVTLSLYPQVRQIKELMIASGADGVLMSGSGPTVFALVQKEAKVHRIYNALRGFVKDVFVVRMLGSQDGEILA
ncbi:MULTISPECIES: 4-(cytidine 5'-diphospho)-2-C-methyl-D-erythritol kinase [Brevibacillus]|uniref:4-(cytidine 5'-diphospho)-2-C-methyl-D-erythritol kinase n=1 Tax=Brevibacillus TaxID=55080 RepID=UPI0007AB9FB3|nr:MULTISPECIES: 4-(cytidine 5'-diphospho)-2-C-methyl-D-erythritol kinase [Brevibacillus]NRQ56584.1 4-(cytidine 5'-diphospho)-2-C-methyl-D-erythritol kinase [Brevibacillus sp. HD1.4A]KZE46643.1 4-diphosphocytidyl-2C-methyl-D-erythritol kinase [Brevibacillus parabrevis]MBU8716024.1 4-(cytidine 5'-diphospho)-2-C-methyl-D-erythritol kinase [Brevibacillus parabrevis]MDR5002624.1 4-(cytidine 5'-diphospho)-2-C-methyl-D-erythritol kinase [Brevibacillus parabrevis]MED2256936.1 4-(cytidine 5'-diphospho